MKRTILSLLICTMSLAAFAQEGSVMARYVPERFDDFVWENEYICHRMYGKALEGNPTTPGVDVWVKYPGKLVANKLYDNELNQGHSYHKDWGDGKDCYKVAKTLGAGGSCIILDDNFCFPATNYRNWEIDEQTSDHITFTLHYPEWQVNGAYISYDKRITVYSGTYFCKSEDTYNFYGNCPDTLVVAAGIVLHDVEDKYIGRDCISIWEKASDLCGEPEDGRIGISIYCPGTRTSKKSNHLICKKKIKSGDTFEYWFASCWSKGEIKTSDEWFKKLQQFSGEYVVNPGEVIVIPDGDYRDKIIRVSGAGVEGNPAVIKAQTPGGVVMKGSSAIILDGEYINCDGFLFNNLDTSFPSSILICGSDSHHCSFTNCKIDGTSSKISETDTKWVSLYGHHNEVSHCSFVDKRNMGCLFVVWLEKGIIPEHRIMNNYFTRPYSFLNEKGGALNGQESLRIGTSHFSMQDARCVVSGNYFHFCNGERNEIISNKSCENVYEGNLFEDGIGTLTLRHGNRCIVKGNYFISNGYDNVGGIRVIGEGHLIEDNYLINLTGERYKAAFSVVMGEPNAPLNGYWTVKNSIFRNNYFTGCRCNFDINVKSRTTQDSVPVNLTIESNTILCPERGIAVRVNDTPAENIIWKKNKIYGGAVSGVSLKQIKSKPSSKEYETAVKIIRNEAGIRWDK